MYYVVTKTDSEFVISGKALMYKNTWKAIVPYYMPWSFTKIPRKEAEKVLCSQSKVPFIIDRSRRKAWSFMKISYMDAEIQREGTSSSQWSALHCLPIAS